MGFVKDADWVEYKVKIPNPIPDKMVKMAEVVQRRYKLQIVKAKKAKDVLPYVNEVFQLLNIAYSDLYGVVPLTEKQIAYYTKQYFGFIKPDFVSLILDENDKLIAFLITMPSLSKALQKAGGGLFPFGFIHILKALKKNDLADLYLIAIDDAYQGKGVNALLIHELAKSYNKHGVTYAESNHMLEVNNKVLSIWKHFDAVQHKRRRSFIKHI
jgi:GNAT superfamily N-acetyltransferase